MKKILAALSAALVINIGSALAAPINDLSKGETALGIGSDNFYIENRMADNFTLGIQNSDRDNAGNMNDIYGQFHFSNNLRGIVGSRNMDADSKMYLGMAINGPISSEWNGYGSLIAGDGFKELQVGANVGIANNVDLNLNYHSFMPDSGNNSNGVGFGATIKF